MSAARQPTHDVVITGLGPVTAIGIGHEAVADALLAGDSGIRPLEGFDAGPYLPALAAQVQDFDVEDYLETEKAYLDRNAELAFAAMSLAFEDADLDPASLDHDVTGFCFGTGFGCGDTMQRFFADLIAKGPRLVKPFLFPHTYANTAASLLAIDYGLSGYHANFSSGAMSSALAIAQGFDLIRSGRQDLIIAGGSEALSAPLLTGLALAGELGKGSAGPWDAARSGIIVGEGAGIVILESATHAAQRGATPLATLSQVEMAAMPPAGWQHALERTVDQSPPPQAVFAAANASRGLDQHEAIALNAALADLTIPVVSLKPLFGETLGASGVLQLIGALLALRNGQLPPTLGLRTPDPALRFDVSSRPRDIATPTSALVNVADIGGSFACMKLDVT